MRSFLTALVLCLASAAADARPRSAPQMITCNDRGCSDWTTPAAVTQPVRKAGRVVRDAGDAISRPARFIAGRLICAVNVNAELARRGIRGTGSAMAKSFLHWGRASGPVPGAVAVMDRGRNPKAGHVAIVSRVEGGRVYVWNPGRKGWHEVELRRPVRSYRVPS